MKTDMSITMGIFVLVNYLNIYAKTTQINFYITGNAQLRSINSVHNHQIILARCELHRQRIDFLTPIDYTFTNLAIRSTISYDEILLNLDFGIQKTAIVWADFTIENLKNIIFHNTFNTIDDKSQYESHITVRIDTTMITCVFYAIFVYFGMNKCRN